MIKMLEFEEEKLHTNFSSITSDKQKDKNKLISVHVGFNKIRNPPHKFGRKKQSRGSVDIASCLQKLPMPIKRIEFASSNPEINSNSNNQQSN